MTKQILLTLLEENKLKLIHEELSKYNPVDLASLLSELDEEKYKDNIFCKEHWIEEDGLE